MINFPLIIAAVTFGLVHGQEKCIDNKCGAASPCCSQFGFCGNTWEYCAAGCKPGLSFVPESCFMGLGSSPPPPPPPPAAPPAAPPASNGPKLCSVSSKCPFETPCCSQYGFCGSGANYCQAGCNIVGSFSPNSCTLNSPMGPPQASNYPSPNLYPPPSVVPLPPPSAPIIYPLNQPQNQPQYPSKPPGQCSPWRETLAQSYMQDKALHKNSTGKSSNRVDQGSFFYGGPIAIDRGALSLRLVPSGGPPNDHGIIPGQGGFARSKKFYGYGKFTASIKSARVPGVVSAFNLIAPDGDELDFEFVGRDEDSVQTNYYYKGIQDYSKGQFAGVGGNTHHNYHVYTIIWSPDQISYSVDGRNIRTVLKQNTYDMSTGRYLFPTSPLQVQFQVWDGGAGSPGTQAWAGGLVNWKDQEIINNGGYIDMQVDWFQYECL